MIRKNIHVYIKNKTQFLYTYNLYNFTYTFSIITNDIIFKNGIYFFLFDRQ